MDCYTGNIYYYFENLDELIAYANMEYYADYLADVSTPVSYTHLDVYKRQEYTWISVFMRRFIRCVLQNREL